MLLGTAVASFAGLLHVVAVNIKVSCDLKALSTALLLLLPCTAYLDCR